MCGPDNQAATTSALQSPMPRIGDPAPDFIAQTTHGEIHFREWQGGSWCILFSHPADFTPVCSTELTGFAKCFDEFESRNTKMMGVSVDSIHSHLAWVENLEKILDVRLPYPLIADSNRHVSYTYGMLHPGESSTATVRALFFIDPSHTIRAIIYYPLNVGRSVDEVLRTLQALQTADDHGVACPANWKPGEQVIVPPPKTESAVEARKAMEGVDKLDFYLVKKHL
jgi:peroxiredoxin (alkyl hydroperoxide reductase subunit C)